QLFENGKVIKVWPYALGLLIGLPLLSTLIFGLPVKFEIPVLKGFNFAGGSRVIPEFVALTLALSTYTASFIAEIVRAGILSVHKRQMAAGSSLGLQRVSVLRLIVIPQAMRVILPPLTHQYLNLPYNSSLQVVMGYTHLKFVFVSALLLWFIVVPALKFALVDAVWTGTDRTACLPKNPADVIGACWPFIQAKFPQFIYGFYPEPERWRVNLTFILAAILLVPLLI